MSPQDVSVRELLAADPAVRAVCTPPEGDEDTAARAAAVAVSAAVAAAARPAGTDAVPERSRGAAAADGAAEADGAAGVGGADEAPGPGSAG